MFNFVSGLLVLDPDSRFNPHTHKPRLLGNPVFTMCDLKTNKVPLDRRLGTPRTSNFSTCSNRVEDFTYKCGYGRGRTMCTLSYMTGMSSSRSSNS